MTVPCHNCRSLDIPGVGHGTGCLVRSNLKITRKIGQGRPELVALGNGCVAMLARVENREEEDSRGYHLWGPKRVTVSVQASVGYVGVDIKIWLVVMSRRL